MPETSNVTIVKSDASPAGTVVVFANSDLALSAAAERLGLERAIRRAAAAAEFKGKPMATLDLLAPDKAGIDRVVVVGTGKPGEFKASDWSRLGGAVMGALRRGESATVYLEKPKGGAPSPDEAADFCLGAVLRSYSFDRYKSSSESEGDRKRKPGTLSVAVEDTTAARKAWGVRSEVAKGVLLARDLVNEPANVLGPVEVAEQAASLRSQGVTVEVLGEKELKKLAMGALLGVAQGSPRPPRVVVMQWNGGRKSDKPVAFIGKGVVFDTGGISIKPAAGMEDMKGDMAGAAAVIGLMRALSGRKAKVNALGIVGLVENMPSGTAQRPGDIVTAMAGKTIEVVNTDAEGRLVLADLVAYVEDRFKPKFMIDLATLTGAVIVALGHHHAGMFSTDDELASELSAAGEATNEKVWRLPLGPEYDKMIDSKFADMKNVGGREAGSITGAQFIKRFVKEVPWVHLDIAGTAMGSPQTETNRSWASGFGVRLLDRLVADYYEK
jgi:leucyl aminopeptidase